MPKPNRRQPVTVDRYIAIHEGKMRKMRNEGIITDDDLKFDFADNPIVLMIGTVKFGTKVVLRVKKFMRIVDGCLITEKYSYQCHISGRSRSEIFRYDNYHEDNPHEGHDGPHHVHRFDPPGRQVLHSPFEIREEERPLMDEIIKEAYQHSEAYRKMQSEKRRQKRKRQKERKRTGA
jgi:hypothetical protein